MSLFTTILKDDIAVYVWNITETFEDLFDEVYLKDINLIRLNNMKSEIHQRGFLSVRKLLQEIGYNDNDLFYDEFGKPHLNDGKYISISHSFEMSAIAVSERKIGIDIEMQRDKITIIANKFCETEFEFLEEIPKENYIKKLTVIWGVKESVFKIQNETGISFKDHISVFPFELEEKKTSALLTFENLNKEFKVHFEEVSNYMLIFAAEK